MLGPIFICEKAHIPCPEEIYLKKNIQAQDLTMGD